MRQVRRTDGAGVVALLLVVLASAVIVMLYARVALDATPGGADRTGAAAASDGVPAGGSLAQVTVGQDGILRVRQWVHLEVASTSLLVQRPEAVAGSGATARVSGLEVTVDGSTADARRALSPTGSLLFWGEPASSVRLDYRIRGGAVVSDGPEGRALVDLSTVGVPALTGDTLVDVRVEGGEVLSMACGPSLADAQSCGTTADTSTSGDAGAPWQVAVPGGRPPRLLAVVDLPGAS